MGGRSCERLSNLMTLAVPTGKSLLPQPKVEMRMLTF